MAILLEREDLLQDLTQLLDDAANGTGALALVAGEAGSGKTSLVRELRRSAGDAAVTVVGACDPLATPRPLGPLLDFAADRSSGLAGLFDDSPQPIELFASVLEHLKATLRPTLMVIEDVHWADDGTRDFLRFIGRRIGDTNGLVVCTYRDDEVRVGHPLQMVLGQLSRLESTHRFDVGALSLPAVAELVGTAPIDVDELHHVTGGNAFYVTEVVAGGEALPATVKDAVLARVAGLDAGPRLVVDAVSIAPRSLELGYVEPLSGAGPDDLERAVGSGMIVTDGAAVRFRHEIARATVEAAMPATRRLSQHRQMIELLGDTEDTARLAHHAVQAQAPELIVEHAPPAAHEAVARSAHKQAAAFFEATLAHADLLEPAAVADLRAAYGRELSTLGRNQECLEQLRRAAEYYEEIGDSKGRAAMLSLMSTALWRLPDAAASHASLSQAVSLLEPLGPSKELAQALMMSGYTHMLERQCGLSDEFLERASTIANEVGDTRVRFTIGVLQHCNEVAAGDAGAGLRGLRGALERAVNETDRVLVLGMLGTGGGEVRHYAEALPTLETATDLALATDHDFTVAYNRAWQARIAFEQGRWDEVPAWLHLVETTATSPIEAAMATMYGALGRVRVRRGDPGATDLLERSVTMGHALQHAWPSACGLAEDAWLKGRSEAVPGVLGATYERALATDSPWARGETSFWMWMAGAIDGPPDHAAEPYDLQMRGDWSGAAAAWRDIGCPYEVGLALADGDEAAMVEAVSIFDDLGARPIATIVRERLKDRGATGVPRGPTRSTQANPQGLTNRQLEVLQLVVAGMSNGEIADELFLSKKTVEHHVSAIFTKLGATDRAKAIAAATTLGVLEK